MTPIGKRRDQPEVPAARRIGVQLEHLTVLPPRLLAGHGKSHDRPRDFGFRERVRLPRLCDDRLHKFRAPFLDAVRDSRQQVAASVGACARVTSNAAARR